MAPSLHAYTDTFIVILGLCLFILPLYASVYFILSFDNSHANHRHLPEPSQSSAVFDEQVKSFRNLHINYSIFQMKEPKFIDPFDRKAFLDNVDNRKLLQSRPAELLHGRIEVLLNGSVNSKMACGWQANASQFRVHPKRSRQHYPVLCPLLVPNANTFQHFMDGVLPKLAQIWASTSFSGVTYLFHRPWDRTVYEIIAHLNMTKQSFVFYDGGYITSDYVINTCVAPPIHPQLFARVRDMLALGHGNADSHRKGSVVLLTRQGARNAGRNILNNDALMHLLRQRYGDNLVVFRGNLSFSESRVLFDQARVVIGVHGGAFYNILMSHSKLHVVEIMPIADHGQVIPAYLDHTIIWSIADILNHTYWRINAKAQSPLGNVYVDTAKVAKTLDNIDFMQVQDSRNSL